MLTQTDYRSILKATERGLSIRDIGRRLHHSRRKIREVLRNPTPKRYTRNKTTRPSVLEQYQHAIVDKIQGGTDDLGFCSLTAAQVFRFLRDSHGYVGCYAQVLRYLKAKDLLRSGGRAPNVDIQEGHRKNACRSTLEILSLVSTRSAKSILEDIARLDLRNATEVNIKTFQTRITTDYLAESNTTRRGSRESLTDWLFQILLQNGTPEGLRGICSHNESPVLMKLLKSKSMRHRRQTATIVLHKKGLSLRAISRMLKSSRKTVAKHWHDYEEHGLSETTSSSQRHRKASDEALRNGVFSLLHSPPSDHGINRTTWTMEHLRNVLRLQGQSAGIHVIREIIRSAGYKWRKARKVLTSHDPEYREKLDRITAILSSLGNDERFFSVDEFGPFAVTMKGGRRLVAPGEHPQVPQFQKSKGSLIVTAALELSSNQVTHFYSKAKNTAEMIKLLDVLLKQYNECRKLFLSWDAGSWHASKALYARVEEVNEQRYRSEHHTPLVELAPLPASAQFLNVIESVFSGMARAIIHSSNYGSVEEAMRAIDRHFDERNEYFQTHPKRAGNKIWGKELVPCTFSETHNCKDPRW